MTLTLLALALLSAEPAATTSATTPETPLPQLPYTKSLEPTFMDRAIDPCVDFYEFSCGGWKKLNPIPADQASWDVYRKQGNETDRHLWGILLEAAKPRPNRTESEKKIGDYFAACMDEAAIEAKAAQPLAPALQALAEVKDKAGLARWLAEQHLAATSSRLLFGFSSGQDPTDAEQTIAGAYAGGLGLPDRDDYLRKDKKSVEIRARYLEHVAKMLQLLGDEPAAAQASAKTVMRLETELAKASLTVVEKRDPYKVFHRMEREKLVALAPQFEWSTYLSGVGVPDTKILNVSEPAFFRRMSALLTQEPLDGLKAYLRWELLNESASRLSKSFVEENFAFYRKYLQGAEALSPRWKRCVNSVDRDLGEALGEVFVKKNFSAEQKRRAQEMVVAIQKEMEKDIESLSWMSPKTKEQALEKLKKMANKVGYPDKFRDYGAVAVDRADFFGNTVRGIRFESARTLAKIGKPLDRGEWHATPQTVNAYYDAQMNDMNFMAAVLMPPLFDAKLDDAPNYGNTGGTVGHELTHGFDDEGRQFDAKGNLRDWWTRKDAEQFKQRAKCVSDQFSKYVAIDDIKVNGKLTLGEDVADLGGIVLAYRAWKAVTADKKLAPVDGLSPEQRFFVGNAQWACGNIRPEAARLQALNDPHSPLRYRVNGLFVNVPEFAEAFQCKAGQPMHKPAAKVCRVW